MKVTFLDAEGKEKPMVMGCYGIGVTRVAAAAIEQNHDDDGIQLADGAGAVPRQLSSPPGKEPEVRGAAEQLDAGADRSRGIEVLYDDRDERPGAKFKDADLIGIPVRVTVGKKSQKDNVVEVRRRDGSLDIRVPIDDVVGYVTTMVQRDLELPLAQP